MHSRQEWCVCVCVSTGAAHCILRASKGVQILNILTIRKADLEFFPKNG
jgi:hypothetical protein